MRSMRGHHQLELGVSAHIGNLIGPSGAALTQARLVEPPKQHRGEREVIQAQVGIVGDAYVRRAASWQPKLILTNTR